MYDAPTQGDPWDKIMNSTDQPHSEQIPFDHTPIIILVTVILVWSAIAIWQSRPREKPFYEVVPTTENIALLWVKNEVVPNSSYPRMLAANNKIFFPMHGLSAFESDTGKWIWRTDIEPDQLYATEDSLYFAVHRTSGSWPYVGALDLNDGSIIWRGHQIGGVKFMGISFVDNLVYAHARTPGSIYKLYDSQTGELLFTGDNSFYKVRDNRTLYEIPESIIQELPPSYDGRKFFWYFSSQKDTNIWQYDRLISNEVVADQITWGMTTDGTLEGRHIQSGEVYFSAQFSTEEFTRDDGKGYTYTYRIAVDSVDGFVFVWLSSSEQLFAFSISSQ